MKTLNRTSLLSLLLALLTLTAYAQENRPPRSSPAMTASGTVRGANITVRYNSPAVKGRTIWGGLVPYDKIWRAGANEATILETDKEIKVEGKALPAGKYSLFIMPAEKEWTVILNSQTGQWGIKRGGDANLDRANDVLTATVKPKKAKDMTEQLTYEVTSKGLVMKWENVELPISIK